VRGQRRDAEARADVERDAVRQAHGLALRQAHVFLRRPVRPQPGRLPQPDPLSDTRRIDPIADGIDASGAILIRHDLRKRELPIAAAAARLPIGGVHSRDLHGNANLTRSRLWNRPLDHTEHVRPARV
jgi:hypothetical protein